MRQIANALNEDLKNPRRTFLRGALLVVAGAEPPTELKRMSKH